MRADLLTVRIVTLPHGLGTPEYGTDGAAGMDLQAAIPEEASIFLGPGERRLIPCGVKIEIPEGWEGQVRSRSGHTLKAGLIVANAPGTIDSDYRGEVGAIMTNVGDRGVRITRGLKIAQLVVAPVTRVLWDSVSSLTESDRGDRGFGSTGG